MQYCSCISPLHGYCCTVVVGSGMIVVLPSLPGYDVLAQGNKLVE